MSNKKIRAALETRLNALTPAWPTAWENVAFSAGTKTSHQRAYFLPERIEPTGPFADTLRHYKGMFQVSVLVPKHGGTGDAYDRVAAILAHFPRGLALTADDVTVTCGQPYDSRLMPEDEFASIVVTIPWFAYLP